jgi:hypothetical protein
MLSTFENHCRTPRFAHIPALPAPRRGITAGEVKAMTQEELAAASSSIGSTLLTMVAVCPDAGVLGLMC